MSAPRVTALRGPVPGPPPGGGRFGGAPPPQPAARQPRADERLLHPLAARAIAFLALAAFGAAHWMRMVDPAEPKRGWYAVGAAAAVALGLVAAARLNGFARHAAAAAAVLAGLALALLAAGVADELLRPGRWDELAAGIARGIEALPGARVPYRGLDEWLRLVLPLGGTLLAVLAAALAFWPHESRTGFPAAALVALVTLYAVPAVALIFDAEFLRGAALALLVIAFQRQERLRRRDTVAATAAGATAAALALAVAPAIDGLDPWWDYENWALSAAGSRSTTFSWDHTYGPLQWPRDGRELLRIRSPQRAYWKADNLDFFDGERWQQGNAGDGGNQATGAHFDGVDTRRYVAGEKQIRVTVRNLRSETFVTAGMVVDIVMPSRGEIPTARPGVFRIGRELRRGDAYRATVYLPTPTPRELREAGTSDAGVDLDGFRMLTVRPLDELEREREEGEFEAGQRRPVFFPRFGAEPVGPGFRGARAPADAVLADSDLSRTWELAQRLLDGAARPYDYLKRVERHLARGYRYSERPPPESETLDGFLFDSKIGYCQQFSGAMALLLRMGGIPARVATGFSPGSFDEKTREFIVRDLDAHSWVEAFFPGIGWVPFDPTPSTAPPRSQALNLDAASAAIGDVRDLGTRTAELRRTQVTDPLPLHLIGLGILALGAIGVAARSLLRRRRRPPHPHVLELERALRIAGGGVSPATTLTALEARFSTSPRALGYVRALRAQRFAAAGTTGPTPSQRRGLRRALARGGGPGGRLRAWWALPPRVRRRRPWAQQ